MSQPAEAPKTERRLPLVLALGVVGLVALAIILFAIKGITSGDNHRSLRFAALGTQVITAPAIVAVADNRFREHDLTVSSFDVIAGVMSKDAVANGRADVGIVANTPLVMAAAHGEDVIILAGIGYSDSIHAIVSRPSEQATPQPVGYVQGTSSEFFLRRVFASEHITNWDAQTLVAMKPPGVVPAFQAGSVQSVAIWEPYASELARSKIPPFDLNQNVRIDYHAGAYPIQFYLITSRRVWAARRADVLKFVETFRDVCQQVQSAPDDTRTRMEDIFNYPHGWLSGFWSHMDFSFTTDSAKLRAPILSDVELALQAHVLTARPNVEPLFEVVDTVRDLLPPITAPPPHASGP